MARLAETSETLDRFAATFGQDPHPKCQKSLGQDQTFTLLRLSLHIQTNTF